jgi:UDP-4-amino-4,6-dideoxy-N-acetyl-beta-L-altrosamine transaminase
MIPYNRQNISSLDIKKVIKTLKSDYITTGLEVPRFEKKITEIVKSKYAVVCNSATSALHLSCIVLGLKKNDTIWTSANGFVADANCALYIGSKVEFVDIEKSNFNLDCEYLEKRLWTSKKNNTLPKILIPIHFGGSPCNMERIHFLSKKFNFKIIEDASHALGGFYNKNPIGICKYSDLTVFSLHAVKMITTGEGGVITTNNRTLYEMLLSLRSHGIIRENKKLINKNMPNWYYEQRFLGFNYRMTDIQASLGISQLKRLNLFIRERRKIADFYNKNLKLLPINTPKDKKGFRSTYHLYVITINKKLRNKLYNYLLNKGVKCNFHYIPTYRQPYYRRFNYKRKNYPNMELYYKSGISLPIYVGLKQKELKYIVKLIKIFLNLNKIKNNNAYHKK